MAENYTMPMTINYTLKIDLDDIVGLDFALRANQLPYDVKEQKHSPLKILSRLTTIGDSDAKVCRMINAYFFMRAPRYFWQEFATYRAGVESISSSTMHTFGRRYVDQNDFSYEIPTAMIDCINNKIDKYKEKKIGVGELKSVIPEGFLQERAVMCSYQALRKMYKERRSHRLQEWRQFCGWIETLPHAELLLTNIGDNK